MEHPPAMGNPCADHRSHHRGQDQPQILAIAAAGASGSTGAGTGGTGTDAVNRDSMVSQYTSLDVMLELVKTIHPCCRFG